MRTLFAAMLAAALTPLLALSEEGVTSDGAITAKATELTTGKTQRWEKVLAAYGFVRDEITQAKTQYG